MLPPGPNISQHLARNSCLMLQCPLLASLQALSVPLPPQTLTVDFAVLKPFTQMVSSAGCNENRTD